MLFAFVATWASVWQVVFLPYYYHTVMQFSVPLRRAPRYRGRFPAQQEKLRSAGYSDGVWKRNRLLALISLAVALSYAVFFASIGFVTSLLAAISMGFFSASIFPIMQVLMADTSAGRVGTGLGLSTTAQSIATVVSPIITASLFTLGVGRAVALGAMIPAIILIPIALCPKRNQSRLKEMP